MEAVKAELAYDGPFAALDGSDDRRRTVRRSSDTRPVHSTL
jgi:hypothetical protein